MVVDQHATEALRKHLYENFGMPGYETSWYRSIIAVRVGQGVAEATVTLPAGEPSIENICVALSSYVFDQTAQHGLTQVKVVGVDGNVLVHRRSIADRCQ